MKAIISKISKTAIYIICTAITACIIGGNASALTYQDNVGLNFTFNPSITVSLSNASGSGSSSNVDLVINDLTPGTSSDSNIIDVSVITNNANGYSLGANVGSSTLHNSNNAIYSTDRLIHSAYTSTDNVNATPPTKPIFTNLTSTVAALTDFNDNTWGYTYSLDNGTTWINAHEETEGTKDTGYNGLPLYSTTPAELTTKSSPSISTGDTIQFKIAAKASTTQSSGEYNNVINFIAVGNTNPTSFYDAFSEAASQPGSTITQLNGYWKMQDMSPTICNAVEVYDDDSHIQLIDTRDNEVYWIGKLKDDRCWLLDNLRLGSNDYEIPLTPQDTNIETAWTLPKSTTSSTWSTTVPRIYANNKDVVTTRYGTASGKVGIYYNYCATSGGTYCYPENEGVGDAQYSVCPKGWLLPTDGPGSNYDTLSNFYGEDATDASSLQYNLSMPLSGNMDLRNWVPVGLNYKGFYWTSSKYDDSGTSYAGSHMYHVEVTSSHVSKSTAHYRYNMYTLRCIANNE